MCLDKTEFFFFCNESLRQKNLALKELLEMGRLKLNNHGCWFGSVKPAVKKNELDIGLNRKRWVVISVKKIITPSFNLNFSKKKDSDSENRLNLKKKNGCERGKKDDDGGVNKE